MKRILFTFLFVGSTLLLADTIQTNTAPRTNQHIQNAVKRVETARLKTIAILKKMVSSVDKARKSEIENNSSINTKIIETHALSQIAKATAAVEIAKAKSMALITKAIDKLDSNSLETVANAIADVEVTKAKAKEIIVNATKRVEMSKAQPETKIDHPKETLTIAKNVSAIQIAKSVAQAEVAKAVSLIDIAKSSVETAMPDSLKSLSYVNNEKLERIKAEATAKISSYLAQIEVMKANMLTKIAQEVAKVEMAKLDTIQSENNTTESNTTK